MVLCVVLSPRCRLTLDHSLGSLVTVLGSLIHSVFAPERILARKTGGVYEPVGLITRNRPEKCCWCVLKA